MDLTIAALVAATLVVGACCGIAAERYREHRRFQRMKDEIERRIDAEEEAGRRPPR